jgi:membrane-associated phospholipid phosphatase
MYKIIAAVILFAALFALITALDFWILHLLFDPTHQVEDHDWFMFLRVFGSIWTWLAAALLFFVADKVWDRAGSVLLAPITAGIAAELLKYTIGRARPVDQGVLIDAGYHFRPLLGGFRDAQNLGMPSSHAAVAFAGAFVLAQHISQLRLPMLALAIGCAYTRIASGAHFPTDTLAGAAIGWLSARAFQALTRRIHPEHAVPSSEQ